MTNKTKVFISIVSHNQENLIIDNFQFLDLKNDIFDINICLIDNTSSNILKTFAQDKQYIYFNDGNIRGFGANHNKAFEITKAKDDDIFIVCNPDIILEKDQLIGMLKSFIQTKSELESVRCYYDREKADLSNPDRYFPCILNFVFSILLKKRFHYGNNYENKNPEWVSGEFMLWKASSYKKINGFDEDFFMYVEDIDICYRAHEANIKISHDPSHYIIHETQMASRKILSKSFLSHLGSVFRYLHKHKIICLLKKAPR
ncbi:MAG: hypothetical protein C0625_05570 [Arcobacter sp.]|nr:MAG: hypothetical protein C0625_05570 [Arcobacter sp.]